MLKESRAKLFQEAGGTADDFTEESMEAVGYIFDVYDMGIITWDEAIEMTTSWLEKKREED